MHAGLCGTAEKTVWQMMPSKDDTEVRGQVVRMVEKCPSERLSDVTGGGIVEPAAARTTSARHHLGMNAGGEDQRCV